VSALPDRDRLRSWFPEDAEPVPSQRAKQALADRLRELLVDVLMLDAAACDPEAMADIERMLTTARSQVAELPDVREKGGLFASEADFNLFERSPFSGRCNALAPPMVLTFEGERTRAHATYGDAYEGPPGSVHGGHVVGAFDDLLGVAQAASGSPGLTGTLTVRLLARTPLNQRIDYEAGVESQSERKVIAWGRSSCAGEVLAEATGIFVVPKEGMPFLPAMG
jgi:hypothetical protein